MSSRVESLTDPVRTSASTQAQSQTSSTLLQSYTFIPHKDKDVQLIYLLNERAGQKTIIFARTVQETERLSILLRNIGFPAIPIHGQLSQNARLASLNDFRSRSRNILITTDVTARGLDIPSVDLVINYDLPQDGNTYINRVGRTARAGRTGVAISLVTQYDVEIWLRIEATLGKKVDEYKTIKDEVMLFADRVGGAQREAEVRMRELQRRWGNPRRGGRRSRDDMDRDDS